MAVSAKHACRISDKGSLSIDGKKVVNLNKITLENLHTLLSEWGVVKRDPSWAVVVTNIRRWYSRQFADYEPPKQPPRPTKKMILHAIALKRAAERNATAASNPEPEQ